MSDVWAGGVFRTRKASSWGWSNWHSTQAKPFFVLEKRTMNRLPRKLWDLDLKLLTVFWKEGVSIIIGWYYRLTVLVPAWHGLSVIRPIESLERRSGHKLEQILLSLCCWQSCGFLWIYTSQVNLTQDFAGVKLANAGCGCTSRRHYCDKLSAKIKIFKSTIIHTKKV